MTSVAPISNRVFIDSAAYFAMANHRDADHTGLSRVMQRLVAERRRFFTTNYIVHETHALLVGRLNAQLALAVLDRIETSALTTVVRVSARDERRAREILRQQTDKEYSLTDAASFAVMERLHISQALTLDHHFTQYGWTLPYPAAGR